MTPTKPKTDSVAKFNLHHCQIDSVDYLLLNQMIFDNLSMFQGSYNHWFWIISIYQQIPPLLTFLIWNLYVYAICYGPVHICLHLISCSKWLMHFQNCIIYLKFQIFNKFHIILSIIHLFMAILSLDAWIKQF